MSDPRSFARPQTDYQPERGGLRPAASPTGNTFVPAPKSTMADEALRALGTLEPAIGGYLDKQAKRVEEQDTQAGREAALEHAMEHAEAVKSGKLPANQSKYFMKGYKTQYGEVLGHQWSLEAKTAWSSSEARNSADPNAASTFIQKFTYDKLQSAQGLDPDVRAGLLPHMTQMRGTLMTAQAEYSSNAVKEKNLENVGALIIADLDQFTSGKITKEQLFATIKQRDAAGRLMGVSNDDLNKTVVAAVVDKARRSGSLSMLGLLKEYQHVGNNPKHLPAIRAAEDAIISRSAALESAAWTREQRSRAEASRTGLVSVYGELAAMRSKGIDPEVTPAMRTLLLRSGDPSALASAEGYASTLRSGNQTETAEEKNFAYQEVFKNGTDGFSVIQSLVDSKRIRDPGTVVALQSIAREGTKITNDRLFNDPTFRLKEYGKTGQFGSSMIPPKATEDAVQAYQRAYAEFVIKNPTAGETDKLKFSNEMMDTLTKTLDHYKVVGGTTGYDNGIGEALRGAPVHQIHERIRLLEESKKRKQ